MACYKSKLKKKSSLHCININTDHYISVKKFKSVKQESLGFVEVYHVDKTLGRKMS